MRTFEKNIFQYNYMVRLKDQNWLDKQRYAGQIAADTLTQLKKLIEEKTNLSLIELSRYAEELITAAEGIPTFKNYKGFPAAVCISVNNQLVHGIPTNYHLQEGDVVSFDLGVTIGGAIADTAITCIYGQPKSDTHVKLIKATEDALMRGIEAIGVGKRIGVIGQAISKSAKNSGFGLIVNYGGHGLDWDMPHASPFVANRANPDEGIHIQPGLSIAIEPMLVMGSTETKVAEDGWTVLTDNIGAHAEHSVFVHENKVEIITLRKTL